MSDIILPALKVNKQSHQWPCQTFPQHGQCWKQQWNSHHLPPSVLTDALWTSRLTSWTAVLMTRVWLSVRSRFALPSSDSLGFTVTMFLLESLEENVPMWKSKSPSLSTTWEMESEWRQLPKEFPCVFETSHLSSPIIS